jgi:hypothetical protein
MEEDDYINAKWAQEDVETLYNLLNKNKYYQRFVKRTNFTAHLSTQEFLTDTIITRVNMNLPIMYGSQTLGCDIRYPVKCRESGTSICAVGESHVRSSYSLHSTTII